MNALFRRPARPVACAAIADLTFRLAEHARSLGLSVVYIRASKVRRSSTKHLVVRDERNRHWLMRISDHRAPEHTGYERPHFDLVTETGLTGAELAFGFLNRVARGLVEWTQPERTRTRKGQFPRGRRR